MWQYNGMVERIFIYIRSKQLLGYNVPLEVQYNNMKESVFYLIRSIRLLKLSGNFAVPLDPAHVHSIFNVYFGRIMTFFVIIQLFMSYIWYKYRLMKFFIV